MKILVHKRIGEGLFYEKLAREAFPNSTIVTFGDERGTGNYWSGSFIRNHPDTNCISLPLFDIRMRCRYLRKLSEKNAFQQISAVYSGILKMLDIESPVLIIGGIVDCYIQDLLERAARHKGIKYVSFVGHFFPGYFRITTRGELIPIRKSITDGEIEKVINSLLDIAYKPSFKLNKTTNRSGALKVWSRERLKQWIYFPLKKLAYNDYSNYHYNTYSFEHKFLDLMTLRDQQIFKKAEEVPFHEINKTVYLPLHFSPEATVDYWVDDYRLADYENSVLDLVRRKEKGIRLVIKEHPAMAFRRPLTFYRELAQVDDVTILGPYENSNAIVEKIEKVLVYTGSVGVEALLRGKLVFSVSKNYYTNLHPNVTMITNLTHSQLDRAATPYSNHTFVKELLQGLYPGAFINDKELYKSDTSALIAALKSFLNPVDVR
jgi:hypothetical protein